MAGKVKFVFIFRVFRDFFCVKANHRNCNLSNPLKLRRLQKGDLFEITEVELILTLGFRLKTDFD